MKILERRDWEKEWTYKFTCPQCESKLEAESKDLHHTPSSGGNPHDFCEESFWVQCPVCSQRVTMPHEGISKYVLKVARDRSSRGSSNYFDR